MSQASWSISSPIALRALDLARLGRLPEAAAACEAAPADPEAAGVLGMVRGQMGQWPAAGEPLSRAVTACPAWPDARLYLGHALAAAGRLADAEAQWTEAVRLSPDVAGGYITLVMSALRRGDFDAVARLVLDASERQSDPTEIASRFVTDVIYSGRSGIAVTALRRAIDKRGRSLATQRALALPMLYWQGASAEATSAELRELGRLLSAAHPRDSRPFEAARDPSRRLRIGYVSQDFRSKATGHFIEAVLAHHDPAAFEVYCYSTALSPPDDLAERLKRRAAKWVDVPSRITPMGVLETPSMFEAMRADRLDIAVDLVGHPPLNLLEAFARRVAPVQATWIGYPATTGLAEIDVRLVDALTDPPGHERFATERLIRLDPCFLCYTPPPFAPAVGPLPSESTGTITFGSFNTAAKIEPNVIRLWSRLLHAVPNSRLLLKNQALGSASVQWRFRDLFAAEGIAFPRLELRGETASKADHLAMYSAVDIALDPFPYNGTTTTVEALWMGVPVLTIAGDRHASRVGVSLLSAVGVSELIATSGDDLIARASALAADRARLADYRRTLRPRMAASPLCDGPTFTRRVESVWRSVWQEWCGR